MISISWKLLGGLWWGIYPPAKTWKFMIVQILKSNVKVRFPNPILMSAGEHDQTGTSRDDNDHFSLITLRWNIRWTQRCKKLQMLQIYLCYFFQLVLIFGPFWVIFGPFWQFWVIFGPIWAILGHFWAILGNFRSFLGHFLVLIFCGKICICAI